MTAAPKVTDCVLDLDGVLVDFYGGVCRVFGVEPWPYRCTPGNWDFYQSFPDPKETADVAPHMGEEFYANLGWTADGEDILARCEKKWGRDHVWVCTSPWDTPGCREGKYRWLKKHLPFYAGRSFIGTPKHRLSRPDTVLIDDSEVNCRKFAAVPDGGKGVIYPRPWNLRWEESCFRTGIALEIGQFFDGYTDGRPVSVDAYLEWKNTLRTQPPTTTTPENLP